MFISVFLSLFILSLTIHCTLWNHLLQYIKIKVCYWCRIPHSIFVNMKKHPWVPWYVFVFWNVGGKSLIIKTPSFWKLASNSIENCILNLIRGYPLFNYYQPLLTSLIKMLAILIYKEKAWLVLALQYSVQPAVLLWAAVKRI